MYPLHGILSHLYFETVIEALSSFIVHVHVNWITLSLHVVTDSAYMDFIFPLLWLTDPPPPSLSLSLSLSCSRIQHQLSYIERAKLRNAHMMEQYKAVLRESRSTNNLPSDVRLSMLRRLDENVGVAKIKEQTVSSSSPYDGRHVYRVCVCVYVVAL